MAENTQSEQLEKRAADAPEPDPIAESSMSGLLLVSSLLLVVTMVWALWDEVLGQRPWKGYQREFVSRYSDFLDRAKQRQGATEREIKGTPEYEQLAAALEDASAEAKSKTDPIDAQVRKIDDKINAVTPPFQDVRSWIVAKTYEIEVTPSESGKKSLHAAIEKKKQEDIVFKMPNDEGVETEQKLKFPDLDILYNGLRDDKARLLAERVQITQPRDAAQKKLDEFMQDQLRGSLTAQQITGLEQKVQDFTFDIKQINAGGGVVIDRCESCHLGVREPITITQRDMKLPGEKPDEYAVAFVSHPDKELFRNHDPERFGCSTCHGGNGRGTTSVEKGHGRYKHWLWPLYYKENVQAGCNQCHGKDRVLAGADVLNRGKNLFANRGCVGCHRYEGFDREADSLSNARQSIKTLEIERQDRLREIAKAGADADSAELDEDAQRFRKRAEALRQTISQLDARISEFDTQSKYLMQDQKKVGPNLKEIRAKLRKEWLPVWLADPQAFRPGTKMPTFRLADEEVKAISAFLWQSALDVKLPAQTQGDPSHGKELFKSLGCLGCHSINGPAIDMRNQPIGGDFAANLSRVGEKASYDYIVRWVHNPRQRLAPYSPSLKRDLTPADYKKKGLPFVFDDEHSKSPVDGRELQIQNMTVMPNFRLSEEDARDIASFLMSQKRAGVQYPDASYLDDSSLVKKGEQLAKRYGCAGCHEIKGLEDEQRIGTELTVEGSKPIERLDFAMLQEPAMKGHDPVTGEKPKGGRESWYDHKGFFENKLRSPGIYDRGKERSAEERLRMPNIYLPESDVTALSTFLLGSVETNLPEAMRYSPSGQKKAVQDGWWVAQKYNCAGCHNVLIGQDSILMGLDMYQSADGKEQLPPRLTSEGARVNPDWLLRFLKDPSLATPAERTALEQGLKSHMASPPPAGTTAAATAAPSQDDWQPSFQLHGQAGVNRNGVRRYLKARMPTFNFSPNELQALVNFFMGGSAQQQPYIAERLDPLAADEQGLARALFTSNAAPCLKCHMTGDPAHDAKATAPNFLLAPERLKPAWTRRWLLDPALISPGTSMPSELFKRDASHDRWVFAGPTPPAFQTYEKDHVDLLVRYMFQITPDEQKRLGVGGSSPAPAEGATAPKTTARNSQPRSGRVSTGAGRAP
ncbi:MAG TPA: c-type cytochrome [Blastocatellia bacterium]|nr:c-type cytochrome [Blastocatellia bacterium]